MYDVVKKIPVILFSAIVPMIMYLKKYELSTDMEEAFRGGKVFFDFFSYYKMSVIICALTVAIIINLIYNNKSNCKRIFKATVNKLLIVYLILVVLSSLFSDYRFISIFGFVDRFEGMIVNIAYLYFVFYINNFVENIKDLKAIIYGIVFSSSIIAFIGITEFFGYNVLATTIGRKLITPISMHGSIDKMNFAISKGSMSSTLYNPNFVGSYMILTIMIGIYLIYTSKTNMSKILSYIYTATMTFSIVGCNSAAGKLGLIMSILLMIVMFGKSLFSSKRYITIMAIILLVIALPNLLNLSSTLDNEIRSQVKSDSILNDRENFDFEFDRNHVVYKLGENNLRIEKKSEKIFFYYNEEKINAKMQGDFLIMGIKSIDDKFKFKLSEERNALAVNYDKTFVVILGFENDGFRLFNNRMKPLDYKESYPIVSILEGKEHIGTNRGYIWKRSIPLMKDYMLLGAGADTFPVVFPQNDIVGKYKYLSSAYAFVDKPHNMYIQTGIQYGVLALIVYLLALILYGVNSLKLYLGKKKLDEMDILGICMICAVFGYSIAGFFNDSNVSVAPLYWTVLGIGLAVNRINSDRRIVV